MAKKPDYASRELEAMKLALDALQGLPAESVHRVLTWLGGHLHGAADARDNATDVRTAVPARQAQSVAAPNGTFRTLADLFAAAAPDSGPEKVLVVAFWIQEIEGAEGFQSLDVTRHLTELGHAIANTTATLTLLQQGTPRLVQQTKKAGPTRQARKLYRLTEAGKVRVRELASSQGRG